MRDHRPKTLIFWGQGDIFFTPEGGEAYLRALPDAVIHRLDAGHFAVEDCVDEIASRMAGFYNAKVAAR
jgi:pimeloyl-ACP methyl ester carboxylesterase